jgi:hypothetical protein
MRHIGKLAMGVVAALLFQSNAHACKFYPLETEAERAAAAERVVDTSTAIIEAEVVQPYVSETRPAVLRATKVIKGPENQRDFLVRGSSSCHFQFTEKAKIGLVVLFHGPKYYEALMYPVSDEDIEAILDKRKNR